MKRRGFTLIELLVVVAIIALLIAILLPSLGKARELSQRTTCGTNLKGLMNSMVLYAHDQTGNSFPNVRSIGGTTILAAAPAGTNTTADTTISGIYSTAANTGSVMGNMWILVLSGVAPKLFICKSDPGTSDTASPTNGANYQTYWNNGGNTTVDDNANSYSFAYCWNATGTGGWWKDQTAASLPLMSDMSPTAGNPAAAPATSPLTKNANSFTHTRDGQNVAFGDSHVDFARLPNIGQNNDNIWTNGGGTPNSIGTAISVGPTAPGTSPGGSVDNYDLLFGPVYNASTSKKQ